jgi:hypothetical protein
MKQGRRFGFSAEQKLDVWRRWKAGQTLHEIGRAFGKEHSSIRCLVSRHGGIAPAVRRRALLALTLREREEISRGLASGSSIREIATASESESPELRWPESKWPTTTRSLGSEITFSVPDGGQHLSARRAPPRRSGAIQRRVLHRTRGHRIDPPEAKRTRSGPDH